jgi:hypothetical protein
MGKEGGKVILDNQLSANGWKLKAFAVREIYSIFMVNVKSLSTLLNLTLKMEDTGYSAIKGITLQV